MGQREGAAGGDRDDRGSGGFTTAIDYMNTNGKISILMILC